MNYECGRLLVHERRITIFTKTNLIALRIRKFAAPVLLMILIMSLIGCAPVPTEVPETLSPIPFTATPNTPPTENLIPLSTGTPFVPKAIIKIAVHVPLSGGQAIHGTDILHASDLAV